MIGIFVAVIAGVLVWILIAPKPTATSPDDDTQDDDTQEDELEEAEREVRELGAFTSPEDADDEIKDWGPGVPK